MKKSSLELCHSCCNHFLKKIFSCISNILEELYPSKRAINDGNFRQFCPAALGHNKKILRIGISETIKCPLSGNIALGCSSFFSD